MELKRDDYCDECWLIVSSENQELTSVKVEKSLSETFLVTSDGALQKSSTTLKRLLENQDIKSLKGERSLSSKLQSVGASEKKTVSVRSVKKNRSSTSSLRAAITHVTQNNNRTSETRLPTKTYISLGNESKSHRSLGVTSIKSAKSNWSKYTSQLTLHVPSILMSPSEILHGARPSDSDLCIECLIKEHSTSFGKNLLKNVYGSSEELHECRMIPVQKPGQGKYTQMCSDSECPRFKFWRIVDSEGAGWKVDTSFKGCFPPPQELGGTSCFMTSVSLCSKEQLVELSQVGLGSRIMDEVKPEIEVSEWFCGRGDSSSRYGFKVSLLDSQKLMMCVYGECRTLVPPEAPRWSKVTHIFRDYEPGVRYVLFHHGGQGKDIRGPGAGGEELTHPGSKMAGASVQAKLPRTSHLLTL